MQAYGSQALEDNSEVGGVVLGRCSIFCICTSAIAIAPTQPIVRNGSFWGNISIVAFKGGVVAYPEMQAYGSLALKDNSEVGEAVLGRCCIFCVF